MEQREGLVQRVLGYFLDGPIHDNVDINERCQHTMGGLHACLLREGHHPPCMCRCGHTWTWQPTK